MAGYKNGRITSDVHRELSALIRELKDPRISPLISIVKVDVSGDLSSAKVYVSAFSGAQETAESVKGLKNAAGFTLVHSVFMLYVIKTRNSFYYGTLH